MDDEIKKKNSGRSGNTTPRRYSKRFRRKNGNLKDTETGSSNPIKTGHSEITNENATNKEIIITGYKGSQTILE